MKFSGFHDELKTILSINTVGSCYQFDQIFLNTLDKHAPMKRKLLRANHSSYISKPLQKAIRRSHLKKFNTKTNRKALKHIRNRKMFAADCIKKKGNGFSIILILFFLTDNKLFWKTIKPFFSNKGNYGSSIKLVEKEEVLQKTMI